MLSAARRRRLLLVPSARMTTGRIAGFASPKEISPTVFPGQPEAVTAGFEGKRNPRDLATGPDRLIPPATQHGKQPFWARLQLLAADALCREAHHQPSQLDWLISMTAMIVLFWSRVTRDLLKSFG
jgi:hypothetical protein